MQIVIGKKRIKLVDKDVKIAKKIVRNFLESSREHAEEQGAKTFYYTLLALFPLFIPNVHQPPTLHNAKQGVLRSKRVPKGSLNAE